MTGQISPAPLVKGGGPVDMSNELMLLREALDQVPEERRLAGLRLAAVRCVGEETVAALEAQCQRRQWAYISLLTDKAVLQLLEKLGGTLEP